VGTGGACGAFRLDEGFKNILRRKLGRRADTLLKARTLDEAVNYFESAIKRQYNPYAQDCEDEYEIPMAGVADIPAIGLEAGYLLFTRQEIQEIFDPVFRQIRSLIEEQIRDIKVRTNSNLKTLFLVGGLGSNQYLLQYLQKELRSGVQLKQPYSGYSAIMRGAVLHGLGMDLVKERLMRRSYGSEFQAIFKPDEHPESLKFIDDIDGQCRCNTMKWYASKGDRMPNDTVKTFGCVFDYTVERFKSGTSLVHNSRLWFCDADFAPQFRNPSVSQLCELSVNHRDLPTEAFKQRNGSNGTYYQVSYQLELTFGSELLFKLSYQGKIYGSVRAHYV